MFTRNALRRGGFVLIEALIALLLISVGLLAVSKLQVLSISSAGAAKSYSTAMALSQRQMEQLRNVIQRSQFGIADGTQTVVGENATYTLAWTILPNPVVATTEQIEVRLRTTWTDRNNENKILDLNSIVAWDDPGARVDTPGSTGLPQLISPTGDALRGKLEDRGSTAGTSNHDGTGSGGDTGASRTFNNNGVNELLNSAGELLLYLKPKNNTLQQFATISGQIYFDQNAGNKIPNSNNVRVRLSSEGECIFNNTPSDLVGPINAGSNQYKYFTYTCYMGNGWYGNVGVVVDDSVGGAAGDPGVCIGDPAFNAGVSNNTLISAHSDLSTTRSYRGFRGTAGAYFSTGMLGGSQYGTTVNVTGPMAGLPRPSSYPSFYSVTANSATDYFNQDFLLTAATASCKAKMTGGGGVFPFAQNAGKYFCISPDDNSATADVCPTIWPNYENQVGSGTGVVLTVAATGSGTGTVTSAPAGISCGTTCIASFTSGASVVLTAVADPGATFAGWSGGGCSGTSTCTVTMSAATTVTATYNVAASYALMVTRAGMGAGTVTSTPAGIACGSTCSASYSSGTSVSLAAAPTSGSVFTGWGGACSGPGACTVTMSAAASVSATFDPAPTLSLTVTKAGTGSGTVTGSPAGIACGATCSVTYGVTTSVDLTAVPATGSTFTGWSGGGCSGTSTCTVVVSSAQNVTATFATQSYAVTVSKAGAGTGTVTSSPPGISCGATCSASFAYGTNVVLTAAATSGSSFTGWSGSGCSGTGMCTISSLAAAASVTATFALNTVCTTPITGTAVDKSGTVTANPAVVSTFGGPTVCAFQGNTAVISCSLSAPAGTQVVLTNSRSNGSSSYSCSKTVIANCTSQTVTFPSATAPVCP